MHIHWIVYEDVKSGRRVEAQVFRPIDTVASEAILFCPGFPGMGAALFEQRHAATLVHAGYAVIVLRHAGTRFDTPHAPAMINNARRLMTARQHGQTLIGDQPATMDTWLMEPYVAIQRLAEQYAHIHVIGNSFGALSAMWSLTEDGVPLAQIKTLLLMAGAQGVTDGTPMDIMRIWQPQFIALPRVTDKVTLEPAPAVAATLLRAYRELPARMETLPESVSLKYLVVQNDEILRPFDTERFKAAIDGRGEVSFDTIDHAHPNHGLMAHDMPDYPTEFIIDLLLSVQQSESRNAGEGEWLG